MTKAIVTVAMCAALLWSAVAWAAGVVGAGSAASCTEAALDAALVGGGLVTFNCGSAPATITVANGRAIRIDTTIDGGGLITLSGGGVTSILGVDPDVTLTVTDITFIDGFTEGTGGAIFVPYGEPGGTLNVINSTFVNNRARYGGAIGSAGTLNVTGSAFYDNAALYDVQGGAIVNSVAGAVTNSTFANNRAGYGGAIYNYKTTTGVGAEFTVTNCTFADNSATDGGAIFDAFNGSVTVANTIVASNTSGRNCSGAVTDAGNNLDSDGSCGVGSATAPMLDPAGLANHGGPTQTIALQPGSPAINAGDNSTCETAPVWSVDQRGYARPGSGSASCSIGAYEFDSPGLGNPTPTPTSTPSGGCAAVPRTGCQPPQRSAAISLNAAARRVAWKWSDGSTLPDVSQFGDPVNGLTAYRLCVYDTNAGPPFLAFGAMVRAGGTCGARPCWKQIRNRFSYANPHALPDGLKRMTLQARSRAAYILVSGRGPNLQMPVSADGIFLLREFPEVIVQLQRSDSVDCWESVFTGRPIHNTRLVFKATTH